MSVYIFVYIYIWSNTFDEAKKRVWKVACQCEKRYTTISKKKYVYIHIYIYIRVQGKSGSRIALVPQELPWVRCPGAVSVTFTYTWHRQRRRHRSRARRLIWASRQASQGWEIQSCSIASRSPAFRITPQCSEVLHSWSDDMEQEPPERELMGSLMVEITMVAIVNIADLQAAPCKMAMAKAPPQGRRLSLPTTRLESDLAYHPLHHRSRWIYWRRSWSSSSRCLRRMGRLPNNLVLFYQTPRLWKRIPRWSSNNNCWLESARWRWKSERRKLPSTPRRPSWRAFWNKWESTSRTKRTAMHRRLRNWNRSWKSSSWS